MDEERKPKVQFSTNGPDEKKPRLKMGSFGSASSAAIMEGIQAGNINISDGERSLPIKKMGSYEALVNG